MAYLFIDTTEQLVLGLLNDDFAWLEYSAYSDKKNSGRIHRTIFDLLDKNKVAIDALAGIIQIAGPGSYTGMRLSEGIVQVFEWSGIPSYSLYHFDIPRMISGESFIWFSNAFKGESFVYYWDGAKEMNELLLSSEVEERVAKLGVRCYTHFPNTDEDKNVLSTADLLKCNGKDLFASVVAGKKRVPTFYYRELESEFKASFV